MSIARIYHKRVMRAVGRWPILPDMSSPSPRNRVRAIAVQQRSMRAVNSLLAVAAALAVLVAAAASLVR